MATDAPAGRANPARGIALIATAVILGLFVLRQGFDTIDDAGADTATESGSEDDAGQDEGEGGDEAGSEGDQGTQETAPITPISELTVRVANTTSVGGAAGTWTESIVNNGYQTAEAADAAERDRQTTAILFRPGLQREATELATAFPTPESVEVAEMPAQAPQDRNGNPLFTEEVQLVVLLGADFASQGGS